MFTSNGATTRNSIALLSSDGCTLATYTTLFRSSAVYRLAVQTDGKVLIGGLFTSYNGTTRNRIARLNSDGSLDTSFDLGTGASSAVYRLVVQTDGKVLIGGRFTSYNDTTRNSIA